MPSHASFGRCRQRLLERYVHSPRSHPGYPELQYSGCQVNRSLKPASLSTAINDHIAKQVEEVQQSGEGGGEERLRQPTQLMNREQIREALRSARPKLLSSCANCTAAEPPH